MIAMKFTIKLDIGLSFLLQAALPQLGTDRETKTHRRERSKRSYGPCRRRTEIPEAELASRADFMAGCQRGGVPQGSLHGHSILHNRAIAENRYSRRGTPKNVAKPAHDDHS